MIALGLGTAVRPRRDFPSSLQSGSSFSNSAPSEVALGSTCVAVIMNEGD